jgi:hypothetical protein
MMSTAKIADVESAGRAAMAYVPDSAEDRHFAGSLLAASIAWTAGFIVIVSAVLFAFS